MTEPGQPVILVLSERGLEVARHIAAVLGSAEISGREGRVAGADSTFPETIAELRSHFSAGRPIIALCAAGIVVRALGSLLTDKQSEPPVIVVAEDGSAVIPLLGGHHGSNELAMLIASALSVEASITTAGDLAFGLALDAPPVGYVLANPGAAKSFMAELLTGKAVSLEGEAPWLRDSGLPFDPNAVLSIVVSEKASQGAPHCLHYYPKTLAIGVGCERGAEPGEVIKLAEDAILEAGLAREAVGGVFSIDLKSDEGAVLALADHFAVPARFFDAAKLEQEASRLETPSEVVFREVGCHGVSEGAALAAVGRSGHLVLPKRKSGRATLAIARAKEPLAPKTIGRARGSLAVVGIGPGDPLWRAPEVDEVVAQAGDLVGYSLYLDLLGSLADGKVRHDFALGEEEERVRHALGLAAEGRDVALVCSGDPGIYAMASLVFELLERSGRSDWQRLAIKIVPGISALQAAAARIGAPLGHDFCAISLSDLLTPWPVIERRLEAAAVGDFVVALYNPVSNRRREQFVRAVEILRAHRLEDTPVVIGRKLGRDGENIEVMELGSVTPDHVDMLSVVLIGSSESRRVPRGDGGCWVYTPRGYAAKAGGMAGEEEKARETEKAHETEKEGAA